MGFYPAGGSLAGSLTSQLLQGSVSGKQLLRETGYAGLMGGLYEGIRDGIDGRRFWDGARVEYQLIVEDAGLVHLNQYNPHNCAECTSDMALKAQGISDFDQNDIRGLFPGVPLDQGLDDRQVN